MHFLSLRCNYIQVVKTVFVVAVFLIKNERSAEYLSDILSMCDLSLQLPPNTLPLLLLKLIVY